MKTSYEYTRELLNTIQPSMAYNGENIEEWKQTARSKLTSLLGIDRFVKVDSDINIEYEKEIEGGKEIRFTFQSEKNYRVPCHLLIPDDVINPPVMICLQGHSTGMHISLGRAKYPGDEELLSGDRDFCIRALKEGFAAIAVEQRNFGECGGNEKGPQCYESTMNSLILGRTTIGERVWDISRLIDVIEEKFSDIMDTDKICCMGNSGGGTATAYLCALEDRIKLSMPSCAVCTYKDSIGAMYHCSCNYVPGIANYFDMNDLVIMGYPKAYIQVSGVKDDIFPISGARYIFNKIFDAYKYHNKDNICCLVEGDGGHRFYADAAWSQLKQIWNKI